ncbi:MAG: rhodanese-like domain-containing protein [Gammaproteobacteria bacterium]|nr:rhodanese-like domain-containing protein [Gammaproteobacteria bacterium]
MATIYNVDAQTLSQWLNDDEAVLIDVRQTEEHNSARIDGATNLPLETVAIDKVNLAQHQNKKLVLHCLAGGRSAMACQQLIAAGIGVDVWNLEGGIAAWQNAGLQIIK